METNNLPAFVLAGITTVAFALFATMANVSNHAATSLYYEDTSVVLNTSLDPAWGFLSVIIYIGLVLTYRRLLVDVKGISISALLLSGLLSIGVTFGESYYNSNSWDLAFRFPFSGILTIAGFWAFLYFALLQVYSFLDALAQRDAIIPFKIDSGKCLFSNHPLLVPFLIIFGAWAIGIIVMFPGSAFWDGLVQLNQYFEFTPRVDQHPWFSTMLLGQIVDWGKTIGGSYNAGLLLWVVFQSTICAIIFSAVIAEMTKLSVLPWLTYLALAFYALSPIWISYAQNIYKDLLFASLFCLSLLIAARLLRTPDTSLLSSLGLILALLTVLLVTCLLRKNGTYAVIFLLIGAAIAYKSSRKHIAIVGALLIVSLAISQMAIAPALGFGQGSSREALSLPFQQTARYVRDYPNDVPDDCRQAIDRVIPIEEIAGAYKPTLSDPVKNRFKSSAGKEDLVNYAFAWGKMLTIHPDAYMQAFFNQTYAYWSPFVAVTDHTDKFIFTGTTAKKDTYPNVGNIEFSHLFGDRIGNMLREISYNMSYIPLFGVVFQAGFYVWIYLVIFAYSISRRKKMALVLCLPCLATILICALSPVNGCIRYLLPVMAAIPLLMSNCLVEN